MDLYTNEDSQELLQSLDRVLPYIEYVLKNNKPMFDGERYPGKVLFRESDIRKVLEDRFRSAYNIEDYSL